MDKLIKEILKKVKQNKKYSTISDEMVVIEIKEYLRKNTIKSGKISKQDISEIRARLHRLYSSYQTKKKNKRDLYLEELNSIINTSKDSGLINITNQFLSITLSTSERLEDYGEIYKKIFSITGKPKTIIDLGSGLNPVSFPYMNLDYLNYYCYDIDLSDIKFLNEYFSIMRKKGLNGKAQILNVQGLKEISKLPSSDIVLMFKLIDLIDTKKKKISEQLIKLLLNENKTRFIVASFATQTISGKPMNLPKRKGFELMLERIGLKYNIIKTKNEIFYVIGK